MYLLPKERAIELRHKIFEENKKELKQALDELFENNMFSQE